MSYLNPFWPRDLILAHRCEFRSHRRKSGESSSDYGYSLRRLGCLAFPDMTNKDREINVLEQFINGIGNSAIHDHVLFHHPQSLKADEKDVVSHWISQLNMSKPVKLEGYLFSSFGRVLDINLETPVQFPLWVNWLFLHFLSFTLYLVPWPASGTDKVDRPARGGPGWIFRMKILKGICL